MFPQIDTLFRPQLNGNSDPINLAQQAFVKWLAVEDAAQQELYRLYRAYYDGVQETRITDRQRAYLQVGHNQEFNANYCPIVVDSLAERLSVMGFDCPDDDKQGGEDGMLWQWWQQNRMDGTQGDVHTAAIRDGDTFVIAEWDNDKKRPAFSHELAFDGTSGVKVYYRKERRNEIAFATKKWLVESEGPNAGLVRRLNVYTADAVWRYVSTDKNYRPSPLLSLGWQPLIEEGIPWPEKWTDSSGRPLGIPVFHFRHKAGGFDMGQSKLEKVIPLQDALNKAVIDLLAAADTAGFRMLTATGFTPTDSDGNPIPVSPGGWLYTTKSTADAAIGFIPGEDLTPLIDVVDSFIARIAQVSRTPMSYFQLSKQLPAADSQQAGEAGVVSEAESLAVTFGNSWEDVMIMARRLHNAFGTGTKLNEDATITTEWGEFQRVDRLAIEERRSKILAELVTAGVPLEVAAGIAGYTDEEVQKMTASRRLRPQDSLIAPLMDIVNGGSAAVPVVPGVTNGVTQ